MKAWLVVNAFLQQEKFREIYQWIYEAGNKRGISLEMKTNAELVAGIHDNKLMVSEQEKVDFVLFWDKDVLLARTLEQMGYAVYNSSFAIEACDNKALTHLYLGRGQIPMPDTVFAPMTYANIGYNELGFLREVVERLGLPVVVKECFGSFGQQVYLCETIEQLEKKVKELEGKELIFQRFVAGAAGEDIRLQVVGNQVVVAMKRKAKDGDFRANITNGGSMQVFEPSEELCELAVRCCKLLQVDFAGVDLMQDANGQWLVCEVNSNAHFKNIFDCTGVNTADYIVSYLIKAKSSTSDN